MCFIKGIAMCLNELILMFEVPETSTKRITGLDKVIIFPRATCQICTKMIWRIGKDSRTRIYTYIWSISTHNISEYWKWWVCFRHASRAVDDMACGLRPNCHVPLLKYYVWFTICVPNCPSHGRKTSLYEVTLFAMFYRTPVNNGSMSQSCNGSSK